MQYFFSKTKKRSVEKNFSDKLYAENYVFLDSPFSFFMESATLFSFDKKNVLCFQRSRDNYHDYLDAHALNGTCPIERLLKVSNVRFPFAKEHN